MDIGDSLNGWPERVGPFIIEATRESSETLDI